MVQKTPKAKWSISKRYMKHYQIAECRKKEVRYWFTTRPLFHSAFVCSSELCFVKLLILFLFHCESCFLFVCLSSVERSDTDLYQDKHTFKCQIIKNIVLINARKISLNLANLFILFCNSSDYSLYTLLFLCFMIT